MILMDQNYLEGMRVILAIVLVFLSLFALVNSRQGELVIPRPARTRIRFRRRFQMICTFGVAAVLGIQSMYVTQIPNAENPQLATFTSNWSIIIALAILILSVMIHMAGWWREGTIMKIPLDPDAIELAEGAIERGRAIAHASKTAISIVGLSIELLLDDKTLSSAKRENLQLAFDNLQLLEEQIDSLHGELRALLPDHSVLADSNLES